jgi:hypothetical protein
VPGSVHERVEDVDHQQGASAWSRWARACLLATVTLAAAALAHAAAGAELPSSWILVALLAAIVLTLAAVLGRPLSRVRAAVLVGGGQLVLHGLLTAAAGSTGHPVATAATHAHHGHRHMPMTVPVEADPGTLETWLSHLQGPSGASLWMFAAHVGAAAAVGVWIASGEQALWWLVALMAGSPAVLRLAANLSANLRVLAARVHTHALSRCVAQWPEHTRLVGRLLTSCGVVRRGPPRCACA